MVPAIGRGSSNCGGFPKYRRNRSKFDPFGSTFWFCHAEVDPWLKLLTVSGPPIFCFKGLRAFDLLKIVPTLVPNMVHTVTPNKIVPTMVPTMVPIMVPTMVPTMVFSMTPLMVLGVFAWLPYSWLRLPWRLETSDGACAQLLKKKT